jgi:hypothetical protein
MGISISPDGVSLVHCLSCKHSGSLAYTLVKYSREAELDLSTLIRKVTQLEQQDPEALLEKIPSYSEKVEVEPENIIDEKELAPMFGVVPRYVIRRGLEIETLRIWECGYDTTRKRAVFPVRNRSGLLVGAVGRTVNDHHIRYFNYFNFDKSRYLFGEHLVRGEKLIVVEGLLDTVSVWQALRKENALDEYSVVGLLGSDPSKRQIQSIKGFSNEVILFLDNDVAGRTGRDKLAKFLFKSILVSGIEYPADSENSDPDDVVRREFSIVELCRSAELLAA